MNLHDPSLLPTLKCTLQYMGPMGHIAVNAV